MYQVSELFKITLNYLILTTTTKIYIKTFIVTIKYLLLNSDHQMVRTH